MAEGPADFSNEYINCKVKIETGIGVVVEGILVEASRYWFKAKTDKGVAYVNKAHVVLVALHSWPFWLPWCQGWLSCLAGDSR